MTATEALADLLAAEHAAVYAYGVLGGRLDEHRRVAAVSAYDAHRLLRDSLLTRLRALGRATPAAAPAYTMPPGSPVEQAIAVETDLTARWHDLVAVTDVRDLRTLAVRALSDAAVRATRWRQSAGLHPVTLPWPGGS